MNLLYPLLLVLLAGFLGEQVAKWLHLPNLIGYILGGALVGPYAFSLISLEQLHSLDLLNQLAMVFVSLEIGLEFRFQTIKKLGVKPFVIALVAALVTFFLITAVLLCCHASLAFSLFLGTIGASTAPISVMAIVKETAATGSLTKTMLSVVALDDLIAIVLFGFVSAFLTIEESSTLLLYLRPFYEIGLACLLGIGAGMLLFFFFSHKRFQSNRLLFVLFVLFLLLWLSDVWNVESLLVAMITGMVFANLAKPRKIRTLLETSSLLSSPLLLLFFTMSDAFFQVSILSSLWLLCSAFFLSRFLGKIGGAYLGAMMTKSSKKIKKYLGFTLLSEIGLTVGLASVAASKLPSGGEDLKAIVIASGVVFEFFAILLTRYSLKKSGEIPKKAIKTT